MDRGAAMLAVLMEIYEGGKDLIPDWELKEQAESALAAGGTEGLRRYYEACLGSLESRDQDDPRTRSTKDSRVGAPSLHGDLPGRRPMTSITILLRSSSANARSRGSGISGFVRHNTRLIAG